MKKFILLLTFLISASIAFCSPVYFRATHLSVRTVPGIWTEWRSVDILITMDAEQNRIIISSKEPQIFVYSGFSSEEASDGILYSSYASDQNSGIVLIEIYSFYSGDSYIKVYYKNIEYKYKFESF